jgi:hypothetical protein
MPRTWSDGIHPFPVTPGVKVVPVVRRGLHLIHRTTMGP